jgi:hypothetical protein
VNLLGSLEPDVFRSFLRRLTLCAVALGAAGFVVALLLGSPLGALGVGIGVATGFWNVRAVDKMVSRTDIDPSASRKATRRMFGSRTMVRLSAITALEIVAVVIEAPLGIGIVVGLVIFQLSFVGNVIGAMLAQGGVQ